VHIHKLARGMFCTGIALYRAEIFAGNSRSLYTLGGTAPCAVLRTRVFVVVVVAHHNTRPRAGVPAMHAHTRYSNKIRKTSGISRRADLDRCVWRLHAQPYMILCTHLICCRVQKYAPLGRVEGPFCAAPPLLLTQIIDPASALRSLCKSRFFFF